VPCYRKPFDSISYGSGMIAQFPVHGGIVTETRIQKLGSDNGQPLFDYLIGEREQRWWYGETEYPRGLLIDDQLEFRGPAPPASPQAWPLAQRREKVTGSRWCARKAAEAGGLMSYESSIEGRISAVPSLEAALYRLKRVLLIGLKSGSKTITTAHSQCR
jgi:hypothetical protein